MKVIRKQVLEGLRKDTSDKAGQDNDEGLGGHASTTCQETKQWNGFSRQCADMWGLQNEDGDDLKLSSR